MGNTYNTVNSKQVTDLNLIPAMIDRLVLAPDPLIIKDSGKPAAALIRITDYERLVDYDRAAARDENSQRKEMVARVNSSEQGKVITDLSELTIDPHSAQ